VRFVSHYSGERAQSVGPQKHIKISSPEPTTIVPLNHWDSVCTRASQLLHQQEKLMDCRLGFYESWMEIGRGGLVAEAEHDRTLEEQLEYLALLWKEEVGWAWKCL
jgi:hypothetical protein